MAEIRPKRIELSDGVAVTVGGAIPLDAPSIIDFIKTVLKGSDWWSSAQINLP